MTSQPHTNDNNIPLTGDHVFISNIDVADDGYQSIKRTGNTIMLGNVRNGYIVRSFVRTLCRLYIVANFIFFLI